MDKAWADSGLSFEDEAWAFRRSEGAIERLWKRNYRVVNSETKKFMEENKNWLKNALLVDAYMEGYRDGKTN